MNQIDATKLIESMEALASQAKGAKIEMRPDSNPEGFQAAFKHALDSVNDLKMESSEKAMRYEKGDPAVDLADVMISMQKSSVATQALVQVRNQVVNAYQDIMNMPI